MLQVLGVCVSIGMMAQVGASGMMRTRANARDKATTVVKSDGDTEMRSMSASRTVLRADYGELENISAMVNIDSRSLLSARGCSDNQKKKIHDVGKLRKSPFGQITNPCPNQRTNCLRPNYLPCDTVIEICQLGWDESPCLAQYVSEMCQHTKEGKGDNYGDGRFCMKNNDDPPAWFEQVAATQRPFADGQSISIAAENAEQLGGRRRRRRGGGRSELEQQKEDAEDDSSLSLVTGADDGTAATSGTSGDEDSLLQRSGSSKHADLSVAEEQGTHLDAILKKKESVDC